MKNSSLLLTVFAMSCCFTFGLMPNSLAQIELESSLEHTLYLQYEPIQVKTMVKSTLGQPTVLNAEDRGPRFYYIVKDIDGRELDIRPDGLPTEPMLIPAQATYHITNDLLKLYSISRPGYYSFQPCVDWMGKRYRGEMKQFEIIPGREIARVSGVVPSDHSVRTYSIRHVSRQHQDQIAMRIDDEDRNLCYGVFPLGRGLVHVKPQMAIDSDGNGHVLFQSAPRIFTHAKFSAYGYLIDQQKFGQEYTNIGLKSLPNGAIEATGKRDENTGPKPIQSIFDRPRK